MTAEILELDVLIYFNLHATPTTDTHAHKQTNTHTQTHAHYTRTFVRVMPIAYSDRTHTQAIKHSKTGLFMTLKQVYLCLNNETAFIR